MIDVASRQPHISLDTRPWASVEEFDSARATLDAWRGKHCLKTMQDWQSLDEAIAAGPDPLPAACRGEGDAQRPRGHARQRSAAPGLPAGVRP
jgi:hypothetical protein